MPTQPDINFKGVNTTQKFNLVQEYLGYRNKEDKTILPPGYLIEGSQNVLLTTTGKIAPRKGYIRDGQDSSALSPILSSFDWERRSGEFRHLRSGNDKLQYRYVDGNGNVTWNDLLTITGKTLVRYADWWDFDGTSLATSEISSFLMMCNGTSNMFQWSGGITNVLSATASTITKSGTTTWKEEGFYNINDDKGDTTTQFDITLTGGTTYRYTFDGTGTSPAITSSSFPIGAVIYINAQNFATGNKGVFTITGSGTNYFEVTNASGAVESNKTIGTGFITLYPSQLTIAGTTYTYHGGEKTTTLTNVYPNPSAIPATTLVVQSVKIFPVAGFNYNSTGFVPPPMTKIDNIASFKQQLYVIDEAYRYVYISKLNKFRDYTFSTPARGVGDGALITLDGNPKVLIPQESSVYVSASTNQWYSISFQTSSDLIKEDAKVERLKTTYQKGAQSQEWVTKVINDVQMVTYEPTMDSLGRVANILGTPQATNMSDPIKNDFDAYNFTDGSMFYFKNFIYLAIPKESIVRIYNIAKTCWEAPQVLPISRFSVIDDELYGHSYISPITYKLFTGHKDNASPTDATKGNAIASVASFSYQNFGVRELSKYFNEYYVEGYIKENTTLTCGINYELNGLGGNIEKTLKGTDSQVLISAGNTDLGKVSLGINPLGGVLTPNDNIYTSGELPNKFRIIFEMPRLDFYESNFYFTNNGINEDFQIIAFGPLVTQTAFGNNDIKI